MLVMPIIAIFYNHHGLNDFQMLVVQASYSASIVIFEIPSGYFADAWGRRNTIIWGTLCGTLGYAIYVTTNGFWGFLIAEFVLGIGESFVSGADSAMLYDTLAHTRMTRKYLKLEGRVTALGSFSETIASSIGGSLALIAGLRAPFVIQSIIAAIGIVFALLLKEPPRKQFENKVSLSHVFDIFKSSLFKNKYLSSALIISSIAGVATLSMAWVAQLMFVHYNAGEYYTTIFWVFLNLTVAIVSMFAATINNRLGSNRVFWSIIVILPVSYILMPLFESLWWIVSILFVFYAIRGLATPIFKEQVNSRCSSDVRATVLSIRSLLIRFLFSGIAPTVGWISIKQNYNAAILWLGCFFMVGLLVSSIYYVVELYRFKKSLSISHIKQK